jgi:DNA modification methylase
METKHLVVIGDCRKMQELTDGSIQLIVTSPPYFDVKDYGHVKGNIGSIHSYEEYLLEMRQVFKECYRVLAPGRYLCVNISDIISDHVKFSLPSHLCTILQDVGFDYREDIIWKKPDGLGAGGTGAGRRFGIFIQNPFPMYYYPNNIYEHILVFRKGKFDFKQATTKQKSSSKLDSEKIRSKFHSDIWEFAPATKNQFSQGSHPAIFPDILPTTLISLYSFKGDTILDPFLGSGTTTKAAKSLGRSSVGYELNKAYLSLIAGKAGFDEPDKNFQVLVQGGVAS